MNHSTQFLNDVAWIANDIQCGYMTEILESLVDHLLTLRERGGRLFLLGLGGSAANCSHAVNDFRKIARIQAFTPMDNVAELTARINDTGWQTCFSTWLVGSHFSKDDALFILSVGGGSFVDGVSTNLIAAINLAKNLGAEVYGIVGRPNGYTAENATLCIVIPVVKMEQVTAYSESFQSVLLHLIVTHPKFSSTYSEKNSEKGLGRA